MDKRKRSEYGISKGVTGEDSNLISRRTGIRVTNLPWREKNGL